MRGDAWLATTLAALLTLPALSGCRDDVRRQQDEPCSADADCATGLCFERCLVPWEDEDLDGLVNGLEKQLGSNPLVADTDGDGVDDGDEVAYTSNSKLTAENVDSDGDGIPDVLDSLTVDDDKDCVPEQWDPDHTTPGDAPPEFLDFVCPGAGVCAGAEGRAVACVDGEPARCVLDAVVGWEQSETLCDGLDNDCDGLVDEEMPDLDLDGVADCVDPDIDGDQVANGEDNCAELPNGQQDDSDGDGQGDACDPPAAPEVTGTTPESPAGATTLVVDGTADPGARVRIFGDEACAEPLGAGEALGDGAFHVAIVLEGVESVTFWALAENRAGLVSDCVGGEVSYELDGTGPALVGEVQLFPASPSNVQTVTVSGTTEPFAAVEIHGDPACSLPLGSTVAGDAGEFFAPVQVAADATTDLYVQLRDAVGNTSDCLAVGSYVHDGTPPGAPTGVAIDPASPSSDPAPVVSGSAEPGATLALYSDAGCDSLLASGEVDAEGGFSIAVDVSANATTDIFARASDLVGNLGGCVAVGSYLHDDVAPAAPVFGEPSITRLEGGVDLDIQLQGDAEAGTLVTLYASAACETTPFDNAGALEDGHFDGTIVATWAPGEALTVSATTTDAAGNVSPCSDDLELVGPVSVTALQRVTDDPVGGAWVVAGDPQGQLLGFTQTGDTGTAQITAVRGGVVTLSGLTPGESSTYRSVSIFGVEPGDELSAYVASVFALVTSQDVVATLPPPLDPDFFPVSQYRIYGGSWNVNGVPSEPVSVPFYPDAIPADGAVDLVALALDSGNKVIGWAGLQDIKLGGPAPEVVFDGWVTTEALVGSVEVTASEPLAFSGGSLEFMLGINGRVHYLDSDSFSFDVAPPPFSAAWSAPDLDWVSGVYRVGPWGKFEGESWMAADFGPLPAAVTVDLDADLLPSILSVETSLDDPSRPLFSVAWEGGDPPKADGAVWDFDWWTGDSHQWHLVTPATATLVQAPELPIEEMGPWIPPIDSFIYPQLAVPDYSDLDGNAEFRATPTRWEMYPEPIPGVTLKMTRTGGE